MGDSHPGTFDSFAGLGWHPHTQWHALEPSPSRSSQWCAAANDKGDAAKHRQHDRDIISIQWLLDCAREGRRVAVPPRYYIHRSRASILVGRG